MKFKEIQVSAETIREICTRFLSDIEPLVPLAEAKVKKEEQMQNDFYESEKIAYRKYIAAGGTDSWLNPVWTRAGFSYRSNTNRVQTEKKKKKSMLEAVKFTKSFTLTEDQARKLESNRSGVEFIKLQAWVDTPIREFKSDIPALSEVQKVMEDQKDFNRVYEDHMKPLKAAHEGTEDSFWVSFATIAILIAGVILLLKTCGG